MTSFLKGSSLSGREGEVGGESPFVALKHFSTPKGRQQVCSDLIGSSPTTPAPNTHMAWATWVNTMTPVTCTACQMGTHSRCVFVVAKSSAVLSCALMEGSAPLSNRAFTAFVRPFWAASIRGVLQGRGAARRGRSPSTEPRLVPTINNESAQVASPHTDSTRAQT